MTTLIVKVGIVALTCYLLKMYQQNNFSFSAIYKIALGVKDTDVTSEQHHVHKCLNVYEDIHIYLFFLSPYRLSMDCFW